MSYSNEAEYFLKIEEFLNIHYLLHCKSIMDLIAKAMGVSAYKKAGAWVVQQTAQYAQDKVQERVVEGVVGYASELYGIALALPGLTVQYLTTLYNESQVNPVTKTNPYNPHDDEQKYVAFIVLSWKRQLEPYYITNTVYVNPSYSCQSKHKKIP